MAACREITKKNAGEYGRAEKAGMGRLLDELTGVTRWNRHHAGGAVRSATKRRGPAESAATSTTGPAADAPSPASGAITLVYVDDDLPEAVTQGATSTTFTLDAAGRRPLRPRVMTAAEL